MNAGEERRPTNSRARSKGTLASWRRHRCLISTATRSSPCTTAPGGADIIAFKNGRLFLVDNKAYNSDTDVLSGANALTRNIRNTVNKARVSLEEGMAQYGDNPGVREIHAEALAKLDSADFDRVVMNARVLSDLKRQTLGRTSDALAQQGIKFWDVRFPEMWQ